MSHDFRNSILRSLRKLFGSTEAGGTTDEELLRRFAQDRDEAAFELLVWRHAGLVVNVCHGVLREAQAVEDAFQATFLVLLRKARAITRREALPGWLHRVALRIALRARQRGGRHQAVALPAEGPAAPAVAEIDPDLRQMLHEEIGRLPARYRAVVVCCYLEQRTHEEAARELGWSKGTVAGRLARARELLRQRLVRRGVTLSAAALVGQLSASVALAAAWQGRLVGLVDGLSGTGQIAPGATALAEGVIQDMFWNKLKWIGAALALVALTGLGAALGTGRGGRTSETSAKETDRETDRREEAARPEDVMQEAINRARVRRNLKLLGVALHNYHDTFGYLPPPAITDARGRPILSWRVAILPYIEQDALYKAFRLNEPWDSPHNKKLLAQMPRIFAPISARGVRPHTTYYQYLVGPGAVWKQSAYPMPPLASGGVMGPGTGAPPGAGGAGIPGPNGPGDAGAGGFPGRPGAGMAGPGVPGGMPGEGAGGLGMGGMPLALPRLPTSFPDGLSNTILLVEAGDAVPWTRPDDLPYDPRKPVPRLGGQFANIFNAVFADGAVRTLPKRLDERTLRAIITPDGGEPIDWKRIEGGQPSPGSAIRQDALARLRQRNAQLQEEAAALRDILSELKDELQGLRWAVEEDRLMALDPEAAALRKENTEREKALRQARDEAAKVLAEIQRLKQELARRKKR